MESSIFISSITALLISVALTPVLLRISKEKGFFASINHRSSHKSSVPNTGGIVLCFAVIIPLIGFSDYPKQENFSLLISAFAVLLITGIIDDFNPMPVAYKFLGQFIPAIVIVTSMDESALIIPFLYQYAAIPQIFNYIFWIIFIIMCINAFNLIDGIDGLAIGLGMIGGIFYFVKFKEIGDQDMMIFSICLSGGLLGLLFYNLSRKYKIFIGDTGSLLIGGLMVFFAIKYVNAANIHETNKAFFMVLGSIFLPLADMVRVTLVRISQGISPFHADRRHIHHLVVDYLGGNHLITSSILLVAQGFIIFLFYHLAESYQKYFLIILIGIFAVYILVTAWLQQMLTKKLQNI